MTWNRMSIRARSIFASSVVALVVACAGAVPGASAATIEQMPGSGVATLLPPGPAYPLGPPYQAAPTSPSLTAATSCPSSTVDLNVLVLSANGLEPTLSGIRRALDGLGTPYVVWTATARPGQLNTAQLANGCHALYEAVILTTQSLGYSKDGTWVRTALTTAEWQALADYESTFRVRQVNWYTFPSPDTGFGWPSSAIDTTTTPLSTHLTADGQAVFSYVRPGASIPIQDAWTYLSAPLTDGRTTSLLVDTQGHALAAVRQYPDGRQVLSLTFDSNSALIQDLVLWYGLVNWATRGVFVGERHVYLPLMVDDLFSSGVYWAVDRACGSPTSPGSLAYRTTDADLSALIVWQRAKQAVSLSHKLVVNFAFIGVHTVPGVVQDTLTPFAAQNAQHFNWTNHTYDHLNLDAVDYATAWSEISQNNAIGAQQGLVPYSTANLVTPSLSGLANPAVLQAAFDTGVRFVVMPPTGKSWTDPVPNTGVYFKGTFGDRHYIVLGVPRRVTNLYVNVSTPEQWLAEDQCLFPTGKFGHATGYDDILKRESLVMLRYLLAGDVNPLGFHALNVRAYDGTHSLLSDLVDRTLQTYSQLVSPPLASPTLGGLGTLMAARMQFDAARPQLRAELTTSVSGRILQISSPVAATVPITGVIAPGAETFAGQSISHVKLAAGGSATIPLP
jgi:hypothetical protein